VIDRKGFYEGTEVDTPAEPDFYERATTAFPDAVVEDARFTDTTRPVLEPTADRLSWDAPIHSVADTEALPVEPRYLNAKPSRFGTVEALFECLGWGLERDVTMYGGGQFELGVGREHAQVLASLFSPDAPNDVAPSGYNDPDPPDGLPTSPLQPPPVPRGLGWD
jgi:hypothetical protein